MKVLIYKRTHPNDPRKEGIFGVEDCMGRLRNSTSYYAVIGIGAKHPDIAANRNICMKLNWVGIGDIEKGIRHTRMPQGIVNCNGRQYSDVLTFEHFELYEDKGCLIQGNYPDLYRYAYTKTATHNGETMQFCIVDVNHQELKNDIRKILNKVMGSAPSPAYSLSDADIIKRCRAVSNTLRCNSGCGCSKKKKPC